MLARKLHAASEPLEGPSPSDQDARSSLVPGGDATADHADQQGGTAQGRSPRIGFEDFADLCLRMAREANAGAELHLVVADPRALRALAAHAVRVLASASVRVRCFARIGEIDPWVSLARTLGVDAPSAASITSALVRLDASHDNVVQALASRPFPSSTEASSHGPSSHGPSSHGPSSHGPSSLGASSVPPPSPSTTHDGAMREVVVIVDDQPSRFASAVLNDLEARSGALGVPVLVLAASAPEWLKARAEVVGTALTEGGLRAWWASLEDAFVRRAPFHGIADLETWLAASLERPSLERAPVELSEAARRTAGVLAALARPWSRSELAQIVPAARDALGELESRGIVETCLLDDGRAGVHLSPFARAHESTLDDELRLKVVAALTGTLPRDPFAWMRVAELTVDLGPAHRSGETSVDDAALQAIALAPDAETRDDFWARYERLCGNEANAARALRTAEFALRVGDVGRAEAFGKRAVAASGSFDALLVLGKAHAANADYGAARTAFEKAIAVGGPSAAAARVELADLKYTTGDLAQADALAAELVAHEDAGVRLSARNVHGKLLLARREYEAALEHFCADEHDAMSAGDRMSELRAQVNRAIALLALWRRDEARELLEQVLETATRVGEPRAVTHALGNLATIALLEHRYVDALDRYEAAIDATRRLGDKGRLVRFVGNLAELRIRLGLTREAKQVLAFARRACGSSAPRLGHFHLVAARTHLAEGETAEALRAAGRALACFGDSLAGRPEGDAKARYANPVGWGVGECLRVAARAVLDDGDIQRAHQFVTRASDEVHTPYARAELALLRADLALARGEAAVDAGLDAVRAARDADDDDFEREAHVLVVRAALASGDEALAQRHMVDALRKRDTIVAALPQTMRERYLARRDLVALAELRGRVADVAPASAFGPSRAGDAAPAVPAISGRRIVGTDPRVQRLLRSVSKVGHSDATVLIRGESGTGKELVAEALHAASDRASGPMVKVNCAALVETLLLSELFGHEKGSFTGAAARRRGRFEAADGGTLFLDEIGDISHRTQVALLRVLQEKTFERVGGTTPVRVDVRVVCATHRDLRGMVDRGEFREDLYYRLCGVTLEVPALRDRRGDLEPIANAILGRIAQERGEPTRRLSGATLAMLRLHTWPGNVRELENALRAASLFADGTELGPDDFTLNVDGLRHLADASLSLGVRVAAGDDVPPRSSSSARPSDGLADRMSQNGSAPPPSAIPPGSVTLVGDGSPTDVAYAAIRSGVSLGDMKKQIERECISRALGESGGNITRAATLLGMKRPRLSQLVKQYGFAEGDDDRGSGVGVGRDVTEDDDAEDC